MRVQMFCWQVKLSAKDRAYHRHAFPLDSEVPDLQLRRLLPNDRYVVEAIAESGEPFMRLSKSGRWEPCGSGQPAARHTFSTQEGALNAIGRGERDSSPVEAAAA